MKSNIIDMESHQSCEDEGLGDKAEGGDGDEEDEAEDDEKMSASVLSHRPNQVEKEQVLENILLLSINVVKQNYAINLTWRTRRGYSR